MEKRCSKCFIEKDVSEFIKDRTAKDGLHSWCKKCAKEYRENNREKINKKQKEWRENNEEKVKEYYENNKEKITKRHREYYENNKEYREYNKEKVKEWRENNKEKVEEYKENNKEWIKELGKKYRENNREKIKEHDKEYRENNREKIDKKQKEYRENPCQYSTYAKQLTIDEKPKREKDGILSVICTYCGKRFLPSALSVMSRVKALKGTTGESRLYCSKGCKRACPIFNTVTYAKDQGKPSTSREVQPQLRQLVLARDNYTCQKCEKPRAEIHCHHILPVATNPIESADVDNCITLCKKCHKEAHKIPGCGLGELRQC